MNIDLSLAIAYNFSSSLTNGRGSWVVGTSRGSWVVGVGVGEELIMIINMNVINISYI